MTLIAYCISNLALLPLSKLNITPIWIFISYTIAFYITTLFFLKRFIFYTDSYDISYPTRFYKKRKSISYTKIKKVKYTINQIAIIKTKRFSNNYFRAVLFHEQEMISFLNKMRERGIAVEVISSNPRDLKLYN